MKDKKYEVLVNGAVQLGEYDSLEAAEAEVANQQKIHPTGKIEAREVAAHKKHGAHG